MVEDKWKGSFTVEAAVLVSAVLFLVYGIIMVLFYYHDKNILAGTAYETAVISGRKQKQESPFQEEEIQQLWKERISGKMILFREAEVEVECQKEYVWISVQASRRMLRITVEAKAALTEPEKKIRDMRKLKKAAETGA
nr:pilus assembly protein [uncultured Sellimonas sp.]